MTLMDETPAGWIDLRIQGTRAGATTGNLSPLQSSGNVPMYAFEPFLFFFNWILDLPYMRLYMEFTREGHLRLC